MFQTDEPPYVKAQSWDDSLIKGLERATGAKMGRTRREKCGVQPERQVMATRRVTVKRLVCVSKD